MLSRRATSDPCFGVVLTKRGSEVGDQPEIHGVGTSATIVEQVLLPVERSILLVKGTRRFRVAESDWDESYMVATIDWCDTHTSTVAGSGLQDVVAHVRGLLDRYLDVYNRATGRQLRFRDFGDEPSEFAYAVASTLPMPLESRQRLLEAKPPDQLLSLLEDTVRHETSLLIKTGAYAVLPGQRSTHFSSN
jgi:Lon protease-like protein